MGSTAEVLARGGCSLLSACLVLVAASDPATGAALRPPAILSLTLWASAQLPPAVVTVTPLGGGLLSVASDAVAPHTMDATQPRRGTLATTTCCSCLGRQ